MTTWWGDRRRLALLTMTVAAVMVVGACAGGGAKKSASVVTRCGERLVPRLYEHLNPMPYAKAVVMEAALAESLRKRGYVVYGGH